MKANSDAATVGTVLTDPIINRSKFAQILTNTRIASRSPGGQRFEAEVRMADGGAAFEMALADSFFGIETAALP